MNAFLVAATALLAACVLPGIVIVRAPPLDAIVALGLVGGLATLVLLCLAQGYHTSTYFVVPLVCAACVWVGGLVYVRFVGRSR